MPGTVLAWKGHRGEYGRVCALGRPGAGHVDLLLTRMASDQIHLDREVVSTWRVPEKASTGQGGP